MLFRIDVVASASELLISIFFASADVNVSISGVCGPEYTQQSKSSESYVVESFLLQILQRYSLSDARVCNTRYAHTRPQKNRCNVVDLTQLCIESGVAAWKVVIDVTFLSMGGALLDVATAAVAAALLNMKLPQATLQDDGEVVANTGVWN